MPRKSTLTVADLMEAPGAAELVNTVLLTSFALLGLALVITLLAQRLSALQRTTAFSAMLSALAGASLAPLWAGSSLYMESLHLATSLNAPFVVVLAAAVVSGGGFIGWMQLNRVLDTWRSADTELDYVPA